LMLPCAAAHVTATIPAPVQIDGDAFGTTPLTVEAAGPEVMLIVPR
jgi:diacylglycerol kinase family enzyme